MFAQMFSYEVMPICDTFVCLRSNRNVMSTKIPISHICNRCTIPQECCNEVFPCRKLKKQLIMRFNIRLIIFETLSNHRKNRTCHIYSYARQTLYGSDSTGLCEYSFVNDGVVLYPRVSGRSKRTIRLKTNFCIVFL